MKETTHPVTNQKIQEFTPHLYKHTLLPIIDIKHTINDVGFIPVTFYDRLVIIAAHPNPTFYDNRKIDLFSFNMKTETYESYKHDSSDFRVTILAQGEIY